MGWTDWLGPIGAGLGLAAGPMGSMIGGGLGSLAGSAIGAGRERGNYTGIDQNNYNLPGYQDRQNRLLDYANQMWNRQAPQAGVYTAQDSPEFRNYQSQLANDLWERAQGKKSLAAEQLRQESGRALAQQQAMAASARPGQGAMANRLAMQNSGRITQGLAGQAAMARLAEMMNAGSALGGLAGQARGQDLGLNMFNAGQQQQGGQFNASANLQQQGLNQQGLLSALEQELRNAGMQQSGGMGYENQRGGRWQQQQGEPSGSDYWSSAMASLLPYAGGIVGNRPWWWSKGRSGQSSGGYGQDLVK